MNSLILFVVIVPHSRWLTWDPSPLAAVTSRSENFATLLRVCVPDSACNGIKRCESFYFVRKSLKSLTRKKVTSQ